MSVPKRLSLGLVALVAVTASAFLAGPALADPRPDPQHTNIPYLAWRGEEVRLVKCDPDIPRSGPVFVDFLLVDWSGDPLVVRPQLEPGTVSRFISSRNVSCVAGTFVSQKAGLAQIKLVVSVNPAGSPEAITVKHDFNVAWMNINTATLGPGDVTEPAGSTNNLQLLVTGDIPLLSNYGELGLGDRLVMPDDWARLAGAIATSRDPLDGDPAALWDIHDEFSPTAPDPDLHGAQSLCAHNTNAFIDTVDNCSPALPPAPFSTLLNGFEIGRFSRVWDSFTNPTIGPFDPLRPDETLLSNGVLDKGDAPMPSALINFEIAPNTPGGINGVGFLSAVDKHVFYSRTGTGAGTAHNLYAPFYATWLPATGPAMKGFPGFGITRPEASGVSGPLNSDDCGRGNNFPGFLAGPNCFYHYWDFALIVRTAVSQPTGCLPLVAGGTPPGFGGAFTPSGPQHVDVYTDEHGEARVLFNAGTRFFFTNLPNVGINANGGCDIANIPGGVLGTAQITAEAKYPFEPVTARPVTSSTITKTITSRFEKSITCFPKGIHPEEQNAAICVARALDITGAPFVGETVCFIADFNAEDIQHFFGNIPTAPGAWTPVANAGRNAAAEAQGLRRICPRTDARGLAAVEIFNTNPTSVNVLAFFVDEGVLRSLHVNFPITGQQGPATGVRTSTPTGDTGSSVPGGSSTGSGPGSGNSGPSGSGSDNSSASTETLTAADYRIVGVKLIRKAKQRPYMLIRVNGPTATAPVRLTLLTKRKVSSLFTTRVETDKWVQIRGFTIGKGVRTIRVAVAL